MSSFQELVDRAVAAGGFGADDAINAVLTLFDDLEAVHEQGLVADLRGIGALTVDDQFRVHLAAGAARTSLQNRGKLAELQPATGFVDVIGEHRQVIDIGGPADTAGTVETALALIEPGEPFTRPVLVMGWQSWEHLVDHHDQLTDIFSLGLIFASLALGLDFTDRAAVERFAVHRTNLFRLKADLHPIVAQVLTQLTDPDRRTRAQDLESVEQRLRTYRDQPVDFDLTRIDGATVGPVRTRRTAIQAALRDQLFDLTRRNRLVHFKPTQQSLNLTLASVPLLLDVRNITADQLFVWQPPLRDRIVARRSIALSSILRFEDAPYIPGALDKLISSARRAKAEYGMAQLRLVVCFLRWHNLKEAGAVRDERIHSPLLLLPVELAKKRGVRDSYTLQATSSEAEVNPALRQYLKQLYGLDLPEAVDLEQTTIDQFHEQLEAMIKASEPAVDVLKIDRPQIDLIHQKARLRLDQFQRRQGAARRATRSTTAATTRPGSFSYDPRTFDPLGLKLYLAHVRPSPFPLRSIAGAPPAPRAPQVVGASAPAPVAEREATAFRLADASTGNPYRWELDLCAMTLAHFSYRNMTLVRDYNQLVETDQPCDAFDQIFSLEAKPVPPAVEPEVPVRDQHLVVAADATQVATIARARLGHSFIIQGPPGTGKSQTITNLIADYAAAGRRVLFVCEKRAAIDVVFARLRQQGLDELCSLIHDSQADKKAFIQGLKGTYETWLAEPDAFASAEGEREQVLTRMEQALGAIEHFDLAMARPIGGPGTSLRELYERAIGLAANRFDPDPLTAERLPSITDWFAARPVVDRLAAVLAAAGEDPIVANHPVRWLGAVIQNERPLEAVTAQVDDASARLTDLRARLGAAGIDPASLTLEEAIDVVVFASSALFLATRGLLDLLDPSSPASVELTARAQTWAAQLHARDEARAKIAGWRDPLPPADARTALALATEKEPKAFKFLSGTWRALRKTVRTRYDFTGHAVAPSITAVLTDLVAAQDAQAALDTLSADATTRYGISDYRDLAERLAAWRTDPRPAIAGLRSRLVASTSPATGRSGPTVSDAALTDLSDAQESAEALRATLGTLLAPGHEQQLDALDATLAGLRATTGLLGDLLEPLRRLAEVAPAVGDSVRRLALPLASIEYAITVTAIDHAYRADRVVERFDSRFLEELLAQLRTDFASVLELNSRAIRHRARARFNANVAISATSATQLTPEQKALKKSYSTGRRELEHEFGKTMRYKSIRDLATAESGQVLLDLRPIWLMSPLSVSDTLPLLADFDVVIFDEASQVPLEEAVPALYRARQVVIVGDQMQLPPTQFFARAGKGGDPDLPDLPAMGVDGDGDGDDDQALGVIGVTLDGDSFLAQSDTSLPSTMLAWHYRSRSEALIGFSNAAFYGGRLATIPDRKLPAAAGDERAAGGVDALLGRSISVHHLPDAVYESRRNLAEADHIAQLVRELLGRRTGLTVGVVAFSEAQQTAIEDALDRLAASDPAFAAAYEDEQTREEDDQFVGLFVKNLENVQGDERDVIIMSVCYGPGPNGRMLMNFGPINQRGGEKRLNVIFSRAKHHMAIVTTIDHTAITNEYNDGANTLRRFLQYAEAVDRGDTEAARRVLQAVNLERGTRPPDAPTSAVVVTALAAALGARGYEVVVDLGESAFTCDLAVRRVGDDHHRLGVLVDTDRRTRAAPTLERAIAHPYVLQAFGWSITHVTTKDWFHQPDRVLADLDRLLADP